MQVRYIGSLTIGHCQSDVLFMTLGIINRIIRHDNRSIQLPFDQLKWTQGELSALCILGFIEIKPCRCQLFIQWLDSDHFKSELYVQFVRSLILGNHFRIHMIDSSVDENPFQHGHRRAKQESGRSTRPAPDHTVCHGRIFFDIHNSHTTDNQPVRIEHQKCNPAIIMEQDLKPLPGGRNTDNSLVKPCFGMTVPPGRKILQKSFILKVVRCRTLAGTIRRVASA